MADSTAVLRGKGRGIVGMWAHALWHEVAGRECGTFLSVEGIALGGAELPALIEQLDQTKARADDPSTVLLLMWNFS